MDIKAILEKHRLWLDGNEDGDRAVLRYSDLSGSDLRGANLWNAVGERTHLKSGQVEQYAFAYTSEHLQIGCERHLINGWWAFDDARIARMDSKALEFWNKWKPWFQQLIEMSPALPTKPEKAEG